MLPAVAKALRHPSYTPLIVLSVVLLACTPLTQLQSWGQKSQALATGVAVIDQGDFLAFEAYHKLQQLPGYQLTSQSTNRVVEGDASTQTTIKQIDAQGNVHSVTSGADNQIREHFTIAGITYLFDEQYQGWVEASSGEISAHNLSQADEIIGLLPQLGTIPTETGREVLLHNRAATRYTLTSIATELAAAFGKELETATELQGTLWLDDQTGALLKAEISLVDPETGQPEREFLLETTDIGNIEPITAPAPLINPAAAVSATSTAQSWSTVGVEFMYQGQLITFQVLPIEARKSSRQPFEAEVELQLHQLPAGLPLETNAESLLTQLGQQLQLSIPEQNIVVNSQNFRVTLIDPPQHIIEVTYLFQADLQDFNYAELIIANSSNPLFVTVPVVHE